MTMDPTNLFYVNDPFVNGIQTVEDRKKKIDELSAERLLLVLNRTDLQPSVRQYAEARFRRRFIGWQNEKTMNRGKRFANSSACQNCRFVDRETHLFCEKFQIKTQCTALCQYYIGRA